MKTSAMEGDELQDERLPTPKRKRRYKGYLQSLNPQVPRATQQRHDNKQKIQISLDEGASSLPETVIELPTTKVISIRAV